MNYLYTVAFWRRKFCAFDSVNVVSATELVMLVTFFFFMPDAEDDLEDVPRRVFDSLVMLVYWIMLIFQATSKTPEALLWTIRGALVSEGARPAYQIHVYSLITVICLQVGVYSIIIVGFTCTIITPGGFEIHRCLSTLEYTQTL